MKLKRFVQLISGFAADSDTGWAQNHHHAKIDSAVDCCTAGDTGSHHADTKSRATHTSKTLEQNYDVRL